ncbi:MAPEG family protein [Planctobacterium marinum]|uniref:MAPEG family protein n=1 Tax=Planctobacterium marinum TaxID=1631968 RepID=UPI001E37A507|nr:MAPEG family protein [Planctobacterium marinum]MCC2608216.1 MAPEG family protein [Planctobacterium marinum]
MSATVIALAGYIAWTIVLLIALIVFRSIVVVKGEKAANQFNASGEDVSPFGSRLTRAQANCVESFPIVGGTLLLALATGQQELTNGLALVVFAARLAQSCVHLLSTSIIAVQLRLVLFLVQIVICLYWVFSIIF